MSQLTNENLKVNREKKSKADSITCPNTACLLFMAIVSKFKFLANSSPRLKEKQDKYVEKSKIPSSRNTGTFLTALEVTRVQIDLIV